MGRCGAATWRQANPGRVFLGSRAVRPARPERPVLPGRWGPRGTWRPTSGPRSISCWDGISRTAVRGCGRPAGPAGAAGPETVGNFYTKGYDDAWDVVRAEARRVPELRRATEGFVSSFWLSDLSPVVKEAALFNLSTLRSQTFFRSADGNPLGWEGCLDDAGSCLGSCTHVWNYELATPFLFGSMARQMRELEYLHATAPDGAMSFRIGLPLSKAQEHSLVAADGQFGCVVKLYREWRLSGDDEWLRQLWPACRRSLEFAWIEGGWDADRDGLAEGAQHNTMDIEYFGPNPEVQSWYLAALAAAREMAQAVGDSEFSQTCHEVFTSGAASTESLLFNGQYYQQKVMPPGDFSRVAPQLRHTNMGAEDPDKPEFQVEDGCLTDQLLGDTYGRLVGLGPVLDPEHVAVALESIHRLNYVGDFGDWTNYKRTYAVRGERGHIVLSYPHGLPEHPMPYWSEVWTGLEYVYAIGLAQSGRRELAEDVVAAARERFSGARRNPFDEAECGHHYARAMSSWGLIVSMTGFGYDGGNGVMSFAAAETPTRLVLVQRLGMGRPPPSDRFVRRPPRRTGGRVRLGARRESGHRRHAAVPIVARRAEGWRHIRPRPGGLRS